MRHSDEGWLHKAVDIEGQLHIIEELQVFEEQQPVNSLLISAKQVAQLPIKRPCELSSSVFEYSTSSPQMNVYVGSPSGVVQLPFSTCHRYTSCYDCIFARDPHCAWNGAQCVDTTGHVNRWALSRSCVWIR